MSFARGHVRDDTLGMEEPKIYPHPRDQMQKKRMDLPLLEQHGTEQDQAIPKLHCLLLKGHAPIFGLVPGDGLKETGMSSSLSTLEMDARHDLSKIQKISDV